MRIRISIRISAQKVVLISCKVARMYVSFSDRRVFYASHDWPNSNVCVTVGCRLVTINNERAVRTWKPSSEQKICFERIPSRPKCVCKFADWFSSFFQSLQMHCRVFSNLADSSSVKTNQEIIISQKNTHTVRSNSGPGISN